MYTLIDAALSRARTMLTLLVMILIAGVITYVTIPPKESSLILPFRSFMFLLDIKAFLLSMPNVY